jgi:hypothetical protein
MTKIIRLVKDLKEEKLKMIYEVIKIIVKGNPSKSDISSIISSEASGIMTCSDKISNLHELNEEGSYKNIRPEQNFLGISNNNYMDMEKSKNILKRKRRQKQVDTIEKNIKLNQKKKTFNDPPKFFSKVYEMSDKTSLNSFDDLGISKDNFEQPYQKTVKTNKVRIIDPRMDPTNKYIPPNKYSNNIFSKSLPNILDCPRPSLQMRSNDWNLKLSHTSQTNSSMAKCPKVLLDYDLSSHSDLENLAVTSGQDKNENLLRSSHVMRDSLTISSGLNKNIRLGSSQNFSSNNKSKQIFFPCEVTKPPELPNERLVVQNNNIFTPGQKMTPFTSGSARNSQFDFYPNSNLFTNSSLFKQPLSQQRSSGLGLFSIPGPISLNISLYNNTSNSDNK